MQIQISTDRNIDGNEALAAHVKSETEHSLSRFSEQITRVEVHLTDENSDKKGGIDGLRCVMEARLEGRQPIAVTHQATTLHQAVTGAVNKLTRLIESTVGRSGNQRGHRAGLPPSGLDGPGNEEDG
jgi:ribosome-associated translation inhibitor RaiA